MASFLSWNGILSDPHSANPYLNRALARVRDHAAEVSALGKREDIARLQPMKRERNKKVDKIRGQ
jgi:hypothetical protein